MRLFQTQCEGKKENEEKNHSENAMLMGWND